MAQEEGVQTLTRLGLTFSQSKVYLSLLKLKKATAKTISKYSKVARQEVYRILAELQETGMVERIIAMPTEFKPIPIEECLSILIERRKTEISENEEKAIKLLQKLKEKNAKTAVQEDETRFSLLPEQAAVRSKKGTLKNAQRSFDAVTTWRNPHTVIFVDMEGIAEALQRGVKIRVIIDKPDEEKILSDIIQHLKKHPNFNIRYVLNAPKALMSIYDEKEAWICTCTNPVLKECPTLWTNNACLLSVLQDYFKMMWLTAVESNFQDPSPKIKIYPNQTQHF